MQGSMVMNKAHQAHGGPESARVLKVAKKVRMRGTHTESCRDRLLLDRERKRERETSRERERERERNI